MKRNTLNFIIDLTSLLAMWGLVTTGLLMKYVLPPGTGHWLAVKGMDRHEWGVVHFWLAVAVCVLAVVHVLLHWQWVCGTVRQFFTDAASGALLRSRPKRAVWGGGLVLLLTVGTAGLLAAANAGVTELEPPGDGCGSTCRGCGTASKPLAQSPVVPSVECRKSCGLSPCSQPCQQACPLATACPCGDDPRSPLAEGTRPTTGPSACDQCQSRPGACPGRQGQSCPR